MLTTANEGRKAGEIPGFSLLMLRTFIRITAADLLFLQIHTLSSPLLSVFPIPFASFAFHIDLIKRISVYHKFFLHMTCMLLFSLSYSPTEKSVLFHAILTYNGRKKRGMPWIRKIRFPLLPLTP